MRKINIFGRLNQLEGRAYWLETHRFDERKYEELELRVGALEKQLNGEGSQPSRLEQLLEAILKFLNVKIEYENVRDPSFPPPQPRTIRVMKLVKNK